MAPPTSYDFDEPIEALSPEEYASLPTAVLYDLDGFVFDSSVRAARYIDVAAKVRGDYEAFERSVHYFAQTSDGDVPILAGIRIVESLLDTIQPDAAIALTSRNEREREHTLAFMQAHLPWPVDSERLWMNPEQRVSPCGQHVYTNGHWFDHVRYKRWQVRRLKRQYRIVLAGDDHNGVCEMYHQEGITALRLLHAGVDLLQGFGDKVDTSAHPWPTTTERVGSIDVTTIHLDEATKRSLTVSAEAAENFRRARFS